MDVRKHLICTLALCLLPAVAGAYSDTATHPALTRKIVEQFNLLHPARQFAPSERTRIEQGSIDEDADVRFMQHFYDPVYDTGLTFLSFANKFKPWPAATVWAIDTPLQAKTDNAYDSDSNRYFDAATDHTWDRAVYEWVYGSKDGALYSLGHILHLVEDMSVPPHTRDDPHPPIGEFGSIYEAYTKQFTPETIGDIAYRPLAREYLNIQELLRGIAQYTNGNFYSKDTTPDKTQRYREIDHIEDEIFVAPDGVVENFLIRSDGPNAYRLVRIFVRRDLESGAETKEFYLKDKGGLVMQDYWRLLSQAALRYGVATIELFFKQVDEEVRTGKLYALQYPEEEKDERVRVAALSGAVVPVAARSFAASSAAGAPVLARVNAADTDTDTAALARLTAQVAGAHIAMAGLKRGIENDFAVRVDGAVRASERSSLAATAVAFSAPPSPNPASPNPVSPPVVTQTDAPTMPQLFAVPAAGAGQGAPPPPSDSDSEQDATDGAGEPSLAGSGGAGDDEAASSTPATDEPADDPPSEESGAPDSGGDDPPAADVPESAPPADTTPPILAASIPECAASFSPSACIIATTTITILHASEDSDLAYYEVTLDDITATTTATTTVHSMVAGAASVSVRAFDTTGNASAPISFTITFNDRPVIISEIAWAGAGGEAVDEWIELFNRTASPIALEGWRLYSATDDAPDLELSGTIAANGYYLIERKNDGEDDELAQSPIPSIPADVWVSFGAGLKNAGEELILARASTTIDSTPPVSVCGGWCAGEATARISMERKDTDAEGALAASWERWNDLFTYATSTDGSTIKGTPKGRNSGTYMPPRGAPGGTVTLAKKNSPYIIKKDVSTMCRSNGGCGAYVIEPGVVIKMAGSNKTGISFSAALTAKGTAEEPIVFTALADDEYGGDMERNGSSTPAVGSWERIDFSSLAGASELEYVVVRYGGNHEQFSSSFNQGVIKVDQISPSFKHLTVEHAKTDGLVLVKSSSLVEDSTFNAIPGIGLYISQGAPTARRNTFTNNSSAIWTIVSGSILEDNEFTGTTVRTVNIDRLQPAGRVRGSKGSGNNTNALILNGFATGAGTTTLSANELPYNISSLTILASQALVFEPDTKVALDSQAITVDGGRLELLGTTVSDRDNDAALGDVGNNGTTTITIGTASGIVFKNGATSRIENSVLSYLKTAIRYTDETTPIYLDGVRFENNETAIDLPTAPTVALYRNVAFESNISNSTNPLPE